MPGPRAGWCTSGASQCGRDYILDYTGSNPAFVGLDFTITSTAVMACSALPLSYSGAVTSTEIDACTETGSLPLFDGESSGPGSIDLTVNDNGSTTPGHTLVLDTALDGAATCSAISSVISCTATINDIEVASSYTSTSPTDVANDVWNSPDSVDLGLNIWLPSSAGNQFQGSSASVTVAGNAVQWDNNNSSSVPAGCDSGTYFEPGVTTTSCPVSWS